MNIKPIDKEHSRNAFPSYLYQPIEPLPIAYFVAQRADRLLLLRAGLEFVESFRCKSPTSMLTFQLREWSKVGSLVS